MDDDRLSPVSRRLRELINAHGGEHIGVLHSYLVSLEEDAGKWKTDWLTGLPSREYMLEKLSEELGRSFGDRSRPMGDRLPVCLSMFDLDRFKQVNDEFGHLSGDEVLSEASIHFLEALENAFGSIRRGDEIGRWGGDEFMMILPATYLPSGFRAMERIRGRINEQKNLHDVTVSAGISSSDVVGVPLVYGKKGRDIIRRYVDDEGQPGQETLAAIADYAGISGISPSKVVDMLANVRAFLRDSKASPDFPTDFEGVALDLITHYADQALYMAKEGRNRVCAYGEDGFGSFTDQGLWVPWKSAEGGV